MQAVKQILQLHGYENVESMEVGEYIEIEVDGFMPLTIEKVGDDRISVAHYKKQRMDLMRDPEIVFRVLDSGTWFAVEHTQDPYTYKRDENGLPEAQKFAVDTWNENLQRQGFVEAAREAASASSPQEVSA